MFPPDFLQHVHLPLQVLRHTRLQESRTQCITMDEILRIVQGDLLGQHDRRAFACAIARGAIVRHKPLDAGGVYDPPPRSVDLLLALEHLLQGVLAPEKHAFGVDGERLVKVLLARLVAAQRPHVRRLNAHPGIVDHDVHSLVALDARAHGQLDVPRPRDVGFVVCCLAALLADEFVRAGLPGHADVEVIGSLRRRVDGVAWAWVQIYAKHRGSLGGESEGDRLA